MTPEFSAVLIWVCLSILASLISLLLQSYLLDWVLWVLPRWNFLMTAPLEPKTREARRLEVAEHLHLMQRDPAVLRYPPAQVACRLLWESVTDCPAALAEAGASLCHGWGAFGKSLDSLLVATTCALLVLGTLMVYNASFVVAHNEFNDDAYFLVRQLMWIGVGSVGLLLAMRIDYRHWRSLSLPIMFACIGLLVLVLVPGIGTGSYGVVPWIKVGPMQLQPSEIAKLAIILYLADWLARRGRVVGEFMKGLLPFAIIVGIVAMLVEVQPDLGTTAIIVGASACLFFVAGANLLHIALLAMAGGGAGLALIAHLNGSQLERIRAFTDPWSNIQGSGWHSALALTTLNSGGLFGKGLGNGPPYYWVPNAHTDAIFAIIGEQLGLVGCVGVLMLFGILAWRGFLIAWQAPDPFARLFATGLTCMLTLQALVNVAVVTNSLPYTSVTLPLVSFGGSSTVISLVAIGLLLNIAGHRSCRLGAD